MAAGASPFQVCHEHPFTVCSIPPFFTLVNTFSQKIRTNFRFSFTAASNKKTAPSRNNPKRRFKFNKYPKTRVKPSTVPPSAPLHCEATSQPKAASLPKATSLRSNFTSEGTPVLCLPLTREVARLCRDGGRDNPTSPPDKQSRHPVCLKIEGTS